MKKNNKQSYKRVKNIVESKKPISDLFYIQGKNGLRWRDTDIGKWPEVFTTPISVKNTMLTPIIKQAKYLVDYEPSNLYFASLLKQLSYIFFLHLYNLTFEC